MKTLKEKLQELLEKAEARMKEALTSISDNIEYQFAWQGELLYKSAHTVGLLKRIVTQIEEAEKENREINKERVIAFLTEKVMKNPLMDRSSGQLHCLVSLWSKEVAVEIVDQLTWY